MPLLVRGPGVPAGVIRRQVVTHGRHRADDRRRGGRQRHARDGRPQLLPAGPFATDARGYETVLIQSGPRSTADGRQRLVLPGCPHRPLHLRPLPRPVLRRALRPQEGSGPAPQRRRASEVPQRRPGDGEAAADSEPLPRCRVSADVRLNWATSGNRRRARERPTCVRKLGPEDDEPVASMLVVRRGPRTPRWRRRGTGDVRIRWWRPTGPARITGSWRRRVLSGRVGRESVLGPHRFGVAAAVALTMFGLAALARPASSTETDRSAADALSAQPRLPRRRPAAEHPADHHRRPDPVGHEVHAAHPRGHREAAGSTFREMLSPHPLCCPARAEILTGQYAQNNGVRSNNPSRYGG